MSAEVSVAISINEDGNNPIINKERVLIDKVTLSSLFDDFEI
jgi:hypothetical protein